MSAAVRHLLPWAAVGLLLAVVGCSSSPEPAPAAGDADPVELDPPPPDPRLTFDTPYRNVKPGAKYVGDAACAGCHPTIDKTYHQHPMGRSAALVGHGPPVERFDPAAKPTFTAGGFELSAEKTPAGMVHRAKARDGAAEYVAAAEIAIGSGTRGRSYLTADGGAVWQTPVSWFGPDAKWDLSPGFRLGTGARRAVIPECLFCHVDHVEPVPGAENRYKEPLFSGQVAIGCERCHGPGELHVAERAGGAAPAGPDTSVVNPKHLPPALKSAVCEQCHLQGERRVVRRGRELWEFRPGLPMELFQSVFVRHPDIADRHKSVGQFEQMEKSKC
ncbi:MAG: cytochrome c family protein, partial [Gemmataceae bacterium]|nr:cytochrome c family protein [Gemmataceae bacterium]